VGVGFFPPEKGLKPQGKKHTSAKIANVEDAAPKNAFARLKVV
jgi:hypothetical protein